LYNEKDSATSNVTGFLFVTSQRNKNTDDWEKIMDNGHAGIFIMAFPYVCGFEAMRHGW
jgi:hypothetical protein